MAGGAPLGNHNARRAKEFEGALRRALAVDDWKQLNKGCEEVAKAFSQGEPWAAQFVADRLDGKAAQTVLGPGEDGEHTVINRVEERIIDPQD